MLNADEEFHKKMVKLQQQSLKYKSKLSHVQMKSAAIHDKMNPTKTVHNIVLYTERDERSGANVLKAHLESKTVSKSEYKSQKPRGLLHKLENKVHTENVGFVHPWIVKEHECRTNDGAINANYGKSKLEFRSIDIPRSVKSKLNRANKIALAAETGAIKLGDMTKHVAQPLASYGKQELKNKVYGAAMSNDGSKALYLTSSALLTTARTVKTWHSSKKYFKNVKKEMKYERKETKLKNKLVKNEIKKEKKLLGYYNANVGPLKLSRKGKKRSWKKILDETEGKDIIVKHHYKPFRLASKADVLSHKEYKFAKQAYGTKLVKVKQFNTATGRTKTSFKRVVDTSRPKKSPKLKRPDSLSYMLTTAGVGAVRNKALSSMATADDEATRAVGKGLQFGMSELAKSKQSAALKSKFKFEKKVNKAEMKMQKAHNKLQFEQSKEKSNIKNREKKKSQKKAQKKALQKKRNAQTFKERAQKAAKKAREKAASMAKNFIASKGKFILLGAAFALIMFMLPFILLSVLGGGGGGVLGGAMGVSIYPVDNKVLSDTTHLFAVSMDEYYRDCAEVVQGYQDAWGTEIDTTAKKFGKVQYIFGGSKVPIKTDLFQLAAYLSSKYRNEWGDEAKNEIKALIPSLFTVECKEENGDHRHMEQRISIGMTSNGEPILATISIDILTFFIYYRNEDTSVSQYIEKNVELMDEERQKHYELLMKTDGGHQKIGTPIPSVDDWTRSTSEFGGSLGDAEQAIENCVGITCGEGVNVVAGGEGIVSGISDSSITIEYGDDYIVSYYGNISTSQLAVGSKVIDGDVLFITGASTPVGDKESSYNLQLSVYDKSVESYVNPIFVLEGYEGQLESNQEQLEEEIEQTTQE